MQDELEVTRMGILAWVLFALSLSTTFSEVRKMSDLPLLGADDSMINPFSGLQPVPEVTL